WRDTRQHRRLGTTMREVLFLFDAAGAHAVAEAAAWHVLRCQDGAETRYEVADSHSSSLMSSSAVDRHVRGAFVPGPVPDMDEVAFRAKRHAAGRLFLTRWSSASVQAAWVDLVLCFSILTGVHTLSAPAAGAGSAADDGLSPAEVLRESALAGVSATAWTQLMSPMRSGRSKRPVRAPAGLHAARSVVVCAPALPALQTATAASGTSDSPGRLGRGLASAGASQDAGVVWLDPSVRLQGGGWPQHCAEALASAGVAVTSATQHAAALAGVREQGGDAQVSVGGVTLRVSSADAARVKQ
ncbi:unnamed protein product, partial [Symbiodinium sp. KB8]